MRLSSGTGCPLYGFGRKQTSAWFNTLQTRADIILRVSILGSNTSADVYWNDFPGETYPLHTEISLERRQTRVILNHLFHCKTYLLSFRSITRKTTNSYQSEWYVSLIKRPQILTDASLERRRMFAGCFSLLVSFSLSISCVSREDTQSHQGTATSQRNSRRSNCWRINYQRTRHAPKQAGVGARTPGPDDRGRRGGERRPGAGPVR